ncbi:glycosyltransferase family 41 protein [Apiospora kogelbergensis]|uniref:glycosyltransferase family 41 protein n=1 Tax=Apiospora kogelbergensis TaxID=1337665 RepID=UPI00312F3C6C
MTPLVQMHQMVQPSAHREPRPKSEQFAFAQHGHHASRMSSAFHGLVSSHRSFPTRISQPSQPAAHPRSLALGHLSTESAEHHLRRKTPNGTIDAGYDGSPAHLASGPPPLKHMILPGSSNNLSFGTDYERPAGDGWAYRPSSMSNYHAAAAEPRGFTMADSVLSAYGNHGPHYIANAHSTAYYPYNNGMHVPTVMQPNYNQSPGPAVFNNGAVLPNSAWPEFGFNGQQNALLAAPYNATNRPVGGAGGVMPRYDSHANMQTPAQCLENLTLDPNYYEPAGPSSSESPTAFRERALMRAHRACIELLTHLHQTKKSHFGRYAHGSRASSRMLIFPKLPKAPMPSHAAFNHPQSHTPPHYIDYADAGARANNNTPQHAGVPQYGPSNSAHTPLPRQPSTGFSGEMPNNSAYYQMPRGESPRYVSPNMSRPYFLHQTPMSKAKESADILHNLCEQSGWKWVEGMMLGGCLYYGLERYENALEWFSRVVSLDDSNIEALSNVAASLYCLHRNDEAERHWLRAVRLNPSYLEAVEHLVGLLCSTQRSKEAVDIIAYVQHSLRLDRPTPSGDLDQTQVFINSNLPRSIPQGNRNNTLVPRDYNTADGDHSYNTAYGFGSSGYRVAGCENGRIIALIHAKGNMLYALKDIDRASDAFEEAVLISTGRSIDCIQGLIHRIHSVLAPPSDRDSSAWPASGPLLLPPERARHTAQHVFSSGGELPGLRYVPAGASKRTAISTTSNSLLSLAKIFQDGMSNGGLSGAQGRPPSGVSDILALYYLSLSLSESPSTANNVGILLASVQQSSPVSHLASASPNVPLIPGITPGSGLDLALAYYKYGLSLDSKHVHLHTNLGSLLKDIGQLDYAIQMYEQAVACDGTFDIALTNLANAVKDRGRISDAIMYYRRAVQSNPHFAEAVCGLFTALNSVCDWEDRGGVILDGGRYDRWHVDAGGMLQDARTRRTGSGLVSNVAAIVARQLGDASRWGSGVLRHGALDMILSQIPANLDDSNKPDTMRSELRKWVDQPWEGSRLLRLTERAIKVMTRRWYQDKYVLGHATHSSSYRRPRLPASLTVPSAPTVLPFHTFTCPLTAKDIRMISQRNAMRISCSTLRSPWLPDSVYPPPPPPARNLIMQSVFGMHNPARAKAFCYATTASDKSIHRQQIEREAPVFRDVSSWSSERLVEQIVNDQIHILVNLNGYTRGARNEVFAARPAPIQMSFMGFAGSLGAEWCDYILADEIAIPPSTLRPTRDNLSIGSVFRDEELVDQEDWVYSENVIFCRDTFFCCDHAQSSEPEERSVTWVREQQRRWKMRKELFPKLPDDAIILGNFNQLYKIDPTTFRTWLRILSNVPKAYLWLLKFPDLGENNLRRTARLWASEEVASRIIFTDVAPKQQHISRARVCDLFLDTPECNAHTTAADILWSSTPLLTLPRYPYKMCSRMAASILKGALPNSSEGRRAAKELTATDEEDYEAAAIKLANGLSYQLTRDSYGEGRGRLAELRKILFDAKWHCALFNTRRWVRDLEDAFDEA